MIAQHHFFPWTSDAGPFLSFIVHRYTSCAFCKVGHNPPYASSLYPGYLVDSRYAMLSFPKDGHEATDVRDIGLGSAKDPPIATHAQPHQACLLTGNFGFADIRNYVPAA